MLGNELSAIEARERQRAHGRKIVLEALEGAAVPGLAVGAADLGVHDAALLAAYPPERLAGNTDPETLAFDYARATMTTTAQSSGGTRPTNCSKTGWLGSRKRWTPCASARPSSASSPSATTSSVGSSRASLCGASGSESKGATMCDERLGGHPDLWLEGATLPENRGPGANLKMWKEAEGYLDYLVIRSEPTHAEGGEAAYSAFVDA